MNKEEVKLTTEGRWKISVDEYGTFYATSPEFPEAELSSKTLEGLKELIKKQERIERQFTPIDVIEVEEHQIGRLTSRVAGEEYEYNFSHEDPYNKGRKAHSQERLLWSSEPDEWRFVKQTPKNMAILEEIKNLERQIKALEEQVEALEESFEEPVTYETMEKTEKKEA